jgi:hypothetical protein
MCDHVAQLIWEWALEVHNASEDQILYLTAIRDPKHLLCLPGIGSDHIGKDPITHHTLRHYCSVT